MLPVVDGVPRTATALGPGNETTIEYTVEAREGKHQFGATTVLSRDLAGVTERRRTVHEPTVVDCGVSVPTTAVRDLTTVEFREERAAAVVLCVDIGGTVGIGGDRGDSPPSHAVARSVAVDTGDPIGDGADRSPAQDISPDGPTAADTDATEAQPAVSDGGQAVTDDGADRTRSTAQLRERLGGDAQVTPLSPLADDQILDVVRRLEAAGHRVTVVSPDATTDDTVGNRLVARERANRVQTLRRLGVPVVDWETGDHLGNALTRTMEQYQ